ncbi:hypothetical protein CHCC14437_1335 [Bacillus licheniformis]|nr:hypothetical protein CHCC15543_1207 [Bacillus licheniformis]TWN63391.1 hypothetical protein CHCC14437_1335 [Bacillus licheniformis]
MLIKERTFVSHSIPSYNEKRRLEKGRGDRNAFCSPAST